jgi:hypothetical protein
LTINLLEFFIFVILPQGARNPIAPGNSFSC